MLSRSFGRGRVNALAPHDHAAPRWIDTTFPPVRSPLRQSAHCCITLRRSALRGARLQAPRTSSRSAHACCSSITSCGNPIAARAAAGHLTRRETGAAQGAVDGVLADGSDRGGLRRKHEAVQTRDRVQFAIWMAPRVGLEPTTNGLTVRRSTAELPGNGRREGREFSRTCADPSRER